MPKKVTPIAARQPEEPWKQLRENIIAKAYDGINEDVTCVIFVTTNSEGKANVVIHGDPLYASKVARSIASEAEDSVYRFFLERINKANTPLEIVKEKEEPSA